MKFLHGIPYVNSPVLLTKAVNSVQSLWPATYIIDNSTNGLNPSDWPVTLLRPSVPLSLSQTLNLLARMGEGSDADVIFYMHHDAEVPEGACDRFISKVEAAQATHRAWGAAFTNYDSLAAFSTAAMRYVGPWDVCLPKYLADRDYYRRLRLAGYEVLETGIAVHHPDNGGSTLFADGGLAYLSGITSPMYQDYYRSKWGGPPFEETLDWAFNGNLMIAYVHGLRRQGLYRQLADSYQTRSQGVLEHGDDRTRAAQVQILRAELARSRARRIIESGTNKALLGYLLSHLGTNITLFSFDRDQRCQEAVEILNRSQTNVRTIVTVGDTKQTLAEFNQTDIDLGWIQGQPDFATVLSDIEHAMRLHVRTILINDTKIVSEVAAAVEEALALHREYLSQIPPLGKYDSRGLLVLYRM